MVEATFTGRQLRGRRGDAGTPPLPVGFPGGRSRAGPRTWRDFDFVLLDGENRRERIDGEFVEADDPEQRALERLVLHDGDFSLVEALQGDAVFIPASFELLVIPLPSLRTMPA